ncbi:putative ribonuclease H-like domain-containing protein [Tanacetum coccineum]
MALPNEHQLTFSQYPDAKSLFAAIETRFGGNEATKKTLLKQQYKNFSATNAESLDSIFNRLQRIVSRLAILGHEVETMSIDDLYNNFKIVEQKVMKTVGTSSGGQNLAFMTVPSSSSTNDANTVCSQVSATSPSVNTGSLQVCTASVSVNTVYVFMVENPNGSNVLHQDLEQIHEDDLEAMDLKWQQCWLLMVKNEVLFGEEVVVFKREVGCKQYEINMLKTEFEKVKQEKYGVDFKIKKFEKASKDLDQLLGSQITDKIKKGLGYSAVPPPYPLIYNRPKKLDLSYSGLDEFKEHEFKGYGLENSKQESNVVCETESDNSKENSDKSLVKEQVSQDKSSFVEGYGPNTSKSVSEVEPKKVRKNDGAPIIEDWVSDDEEQDESKPKSEKKTVIHTAAKKEFAKPKNNEKHFKKSVRYAEMYRSQSPRGNQRNWNGQKSNQLGKDFGKPQHDDKGFVDSGCSRHMTGNIAYLSDFKQFDGGYVAFGGGAYGGKISGKGTLKTDNLDFEDLHDENQILLKVPRKDNMYSFDMKNIVPKESLTCLVANATLDESMLWHRRLGKQNRASCKSKVLNPITKPLFMLHMDLFGLTFVSSLMHKKYCLVVTDDYSRFTWVFFLTTKDETSEILKHFIKEIENPVDKKVKIIRSDNGTEFKSKVINDFYREKSIKREYSVARTPQ